MEHMERDFKGIWIPKEIWLSQELSLQEKVFLVEINSLDNEQGCFASNQYFSEFFGLSRNRCSEVIKSLEKKKFVSIEYIKEKDKNNIEKRIIKIINSPKEGIRKIEQGIRKVEGGIRNIETGYSEKGEDNNISSNNTSNNTSNKKDIYISIINHLNEKCEKEFKTSTKATLKLIDQRIKDGFTLEDFIKVIDIKSDEWLHDTKMNVYLRPETLFGTKFESYLNQPKGVKYNESGNRTEGTAEVYNYDKFFN